MKKFSFFAAAIVATLITSSAQAAEEIAGRCTCPNGGELVFFTGNSPVNVDCEKTCANLPARLRDGQEIVVEQKGHIRVPELDITARCAGSPDPNDPNCSGTSGSGGGGVPCWVWFLIGAALGGLLGWLLWGRRRLCPDPTAHNHTCPTPCLNPRAHQTSPEEQEAARQRRHQLHGQAAECDSLACRYGEAKRDGDRVAAGHWWREWNRAFHRLYALMGKELGEDIVPEPKPLRELPDVTIAVRCDDTDTWRRSDREEARPAPEPTPSVPTGHSAR